MTNPQDVAEKLNELQRQGWTIHFQSDKLVCTLPGGDQSIGEDDTVYEIQQLASALFVAK